MVVVTSYMAKLTSVVVPITSVVVESMLPFVVVWTNVVEIVLVITELVTRQLHAAEITDSA